MLKKIILSTFFFQYLTLNAFSQECLKQSECRQGHICKAFMCIEQVIITKAQFELLSNEIKLYESNKVVTIEDVIGR